MKYFYVTSARVPGRKAHCSQIAQMCRAFSEAGLELELLHPARSRHGDYRRATVESWYGFDEFVPEKRLFCIDYVGRIPKFLPHRVTSIAYRIMVRTFTTSAIRYLRACPRERYGLYSRDPKVLYQLIQAFPDQSSYLELHMLREKPAFPGENALLAGVHGIIVVTHRMKTMLLERGVDEDRILVEPNGVDPRSFPGSYDKLGARRVLSLNRERKYITFVGNFRALNVERGLDTLIRAIPAVTERHPDTTFLFVGGPVEQASTYQKELDALGVDERNYRFLDRQPYDEIHLWLAASDILVHPIPEHPIYTNITSPLKIFEYMTADRPIVASDLPSIREILEHERNALLSPPGDVQTFAGAFIRLLDDRDLARRLSREARREADNRTWKARARRIKDWMDAGNCSR
ncbi:MAG: glycosyltransferase family 4 protein [Gammaproteobacteria bacterium]|nr:glycosyltransferase family 4 protein [Gammaproteobacteria bacterium]